MAYTKQQIADYARKLGAAGAKPEEIEAFVANASRDVVQDGQPEARPRVYRNPRTGLPERNSVANPQDFQRDTANFVRMAGTAAGALAPVPGGTAVGAIAGELAGGAIEGKVKPGAAVGAGIANALIPGSAAARTVAGTAIRAGMLGGQNLAAKAAETGIDEGRLPSIREALIATGSGAIGGPMERLPGATSRGPGVLPEGMTVTERDNLIAGMEKGLRVAPVEVRNNWLERRMMGAAGPTDVRAVIKQQNQGTVNNLTKQDINIPAGQDITDSAIKTEVARASQPMREIENLGPDFKAALEDVRRKREAASLAWQGYKADYRKTPLSEVQAANQAAEDADLNLELMLAQVDPTLSNRYAQARREVARAKTAQDALNPDSANIDAGELADRSQARLRTDGNMGLIGRFSNTEVGGQYVGRRTTVPPGTQALRTGMAMTNAGSPEQLATNGGYLLVNDIARKYLTSDGKQKQILEDLLGRMAVDRNLEAVRRAISTAGR